MAGFQLFMPMPAAAVDAGRDYENQLMIGNGPYAMESPRTDEEIDLVKNDSWDGDFSGNTWDQRPDRIAFRVSSDADTSYNALEAGEGDTALIPSGARPRRWPTGAPRPTPRSWVRTTSVFNDRDPRVGGPENLKLRQAISQAIDRDAINDAIYDGVRAVADGHHARGHPRLQARPVRVLLVRPRRRPGGLRRVDGGRQRAERADPDPVRRRRRARRRHPADHRQPGRHRHPGRPRRARHHHVLLGDGRRRRASLCRSGWIADYPTYDNFMYDLFGTESLDGNNYGYSNPKFDDLVAQAKQTVDPTEQAAAVQPGRGQSCSTTTSTRSRCCSTAASTPSTPTVCRTSTRRH